MIATERNADPNSEQARKKSDLIRRLEQLIEDAECGRLFGEFGVTFSVQGGKIGHYEELKRQTFK